MLPTTAATPVQAISGNAAQPVPDRPRKRVWALLVATVLGACIAAPWLAPSIPDLIARAVPGSSESIRTSAPAPLPPDQGPVPAVPVVPYPTDLASAGRPLEIKVPRLRVASAVVPISGQSGELVPPADPRLIGWWREGSPAGVARGSVVLTGHTVSTGGGAFDKLGELRAGDRIRVRTHAGWISYVVGATRNLSTDQLAAKAREIFDLDGPGRLVLITCSDWDGEVYLSNAIVFAIPVVDEPAATRTPAAPPQIPLSQQS